MKTFTPLKIFTIFLFLVLIVLFISYRVGVFSDGNLITAKSTDTIPAAFRDSVIREYSMTTLSTSKSIIIPDTNDSTMNALVEKLWRQRMQKKQ
jgi:hypothetical protein